MTEYTWHTKTYPTLTPTPTPTPTPYPNPNPNQVIEYTWHTKNTRVESFLLEH